MSKKEKNKVGQKNKKKHQLKLQLLFKLNKKKNKLNKITPKVKTKRDRIKKLFMWKKLVHNNQAMSNNNNLI
jgi:hypothetical protein